jgi:hypothetical protein
MREEVNPTYARRTRQNIKTPALGGEIQTRDHTDVEQECCSYSAATFGGCRTVVRCDALTTSLCRLFSQALEMWSSPAQSFLA